MWGCHLLAVGWWLPPRGLRPALLRGPPAMAAAVFLAPWARPPPPCAALARGPPRGPCSSPPRFSRWGARLRGGSGCSARARAEAGPPWAVIPEYRPCSSACRTGCTRRRLTKALPLRAKLLQEERGKDARLWKRTAQYGATNEGYTGFLEVSSTVLSTERTRSLERRCR